jgi:hypothetical protein
VIAVKRPAKKLYAQGRLEEAESEIGAVLEARRVLPAGGFMA